MKIALLTNTLLTAGHMNPGDVFIGWGLQYLIDEAMGTPVQWFPVSRFESPDPLQHKALQECDVIVYGGMPQYNRLSDWSYFYDVEIWDMLDELKKPIWKLAGGGGYCSQTMTPEKFSLYLREDELTVAMARKTAQMSDIVTVRDKHASQFLTDLHITHTLLPCSGLFSGHRIGIKTEGKDAGVCISADHLANHPERDSIIEEIKKVIAWLKESHETCWLIAQVWHKDYDFIKEHFPEEQIFTTTQPMGLIEFYRNISTVVSMRLHCALPIFGMGGKAVLIKVDTRGDAVDEIGIPRINLDEFTADETINHLMKDRTPEYSTLDNIKKYRDLINA